MAPRYLPHIIYSTALTSISIHLLWHRKQQEEENSRISAQATILQSLVDQLHAGKPIKDEEIERLRKLAKSHSISSKQSEGSEAGDESSSSIGWKDVLLGRKKSPSEKQSDEAWDLKDLELIRQEIEDEK